MYAVALARAQAPGDKATDVDQIGRFLFNFDNPSE
jgi:hypothetical protein